MLHELIENKEVEEEQEEKKEKKEKKEGKEKERTDTKRGNEWFIMMIP